MGGARVRTERTEMTRKRLVTGVRKVVCAPYTRNATLGGERSGGRINDVGWRVSPRPDRLSYEGVESTREIRRYSVRTHTCIYIYMYINTEDRVTMLRIY